ncbi:glycerophosphodiester phosphodiesterase [Fredinandcohnia onubensis]|uniref:glycerophosphodiester phosphodiesterase n=1 Tax=Fredinandcohnia onubensis TaxID=1571209 RepID=UPI0015D508EB|nr:glycerophosphodiester phosphodiesterase family protein [Fredinandcohnia onubensis]
MIKRYVILTLLISIGFTTIALAITEQNVEPVKAGEFMIIAHRGASDRFNEHTLTAYKIASDDDVDYIEIDLRMTKDGELVAMHDDTINRTTNETGKVSDFTLEELKSINTISNLDHQIEGEEEIPSLQEIFDAFSETENFYIETRLVNNQLAMEEKLIDLLKAYNLLNNKRVIIQSFSTKSLEKVHSLAPDIPLTLLYKKGEFDLEKAISSDYPIIGIESTDVTRRVVKELHKNGKKVHVFFTNRKTQKIEQKRMKQLKIDGYFTDYILYTKGILQEK